MLRRDKGLLIFLGILFIFVIVLFCLKDRIFPHHKQAQTQMLTMYQEFKDETESIALKQTMRTLHTTLQS